MQPENSTASVHIYTLNDPDTNAVRYVGKTQQRPSARLHDHMQAARAGRGGVYGVLKWIRALLEVGKRPTMQIIETVTSETWKTAERRWIAHYWEVGANLTNVSAGGEEGAPGLVHAESTRKRLASLARNISEETRAKRSAAIKGRKFPPEWRAKLSASHKGKSTGPCADETKEKISAANKGNKGPRGLKRPQSTRDKMKAAQLKARGEFSKALLSDDQVRTIREQYASTEATMGELADEFNVATTVIYRLIRGFYRVEAGGPIGKAGVRKQQIKCRTKATHPLRFDTAKMSSVEDK